MDNGLLSNAGALQQVNQMDLGEYKDQSRVMVKKFLANEEAFAAAAGMLMNANGKEADAIGEMAAQISERLHGAAKEAGEELPMSSVFTKDGALTSAIDALFEVGKTAGVFTEEQEKTVKTQSFMKSILNMTKSPSMGEAAQAIAENFDKAGGVQNVR